MTISQTPALMWTLDLASVPQRQSQISQLDPKPSGFITSPASSPKLANPPVPAEPSSMYPPSSDAAPAIQLPNPPSRPASDNNVSPEQPPSTEQSISQTILNFLKSHPILLFWVLVIPNITCLIFVTSGSSSLKPALRVLSWLAITISSVSLFNCHSNSKLAATKGPWKVFGAFLIFGLTKMSVGVIHRQKKAPTDNDWSEAFQMLEPFLIPPRFKRWLGCGSKAWVNQGEIGFNPVSFGPSASMVAIEKSNGVVGDGGNEKNFQDPDQEIGTVGHQSQRRLGEIETLTCSDGQNDYQASSVKDLMTGCLSAKRENDRSKLRQNDTSYGCRAGSGRIIVTCDVVRLSWAIFGSGFDLDSTRLDEDIGRDLNLNTWAAEFLLT
ncbi:hypothetical protein C8J56DRAFT_886225 [Mycena floridula]|nr:hypothetical protein C8J56DRAFT_886225 [Mycena floridula]